MAQKAPAPPSAPGPDPVEGEFSRNKDRGAHILEQQRQASGGLDDDPAMSGNPVRNKTSFKATKE